MNIRNVPHLVVFVGLELGAIFFFNVSEKSTSFTYDFVTTADMSWQYLVASHKIKHLSIHLKLFSVF